MDSACAMVNEWVHAPTDCCGMYGTVWMPAAGTAAVAGSVFAFSALLAGVVEGP